MVSISNGSASELEPTEEIAWSTLAFAQLQRHDLEDALASYDRAIQLRPLAPLNWINRAAVRMKQGNLKSAAADLEHFLELAPDHAHAPVVRAQLARWAAGR